MRLYTAIACLLIAAFNFAAVRWIALVPFGGGGYLPGSAMVVHNVLEVSVLLPDPQKGFRTGSAVDRYRRMTPELEKVYGTRFDPQATPAPWSYTSWGLVPYLGWHAADPASVLTPQARWSVWMWLPLWCIELPIALGPLAVRRVRRWPLRMSWRGFEPRMQPQIA